jgi:putative ABC transport system permease protein
MWSNYAITWLRALTGNRTHAFINIVGLALGLAACMMILLFVRYETSYDSWMPGAERAYQLQNFHRATPEGGEEMALQMTSFVSGKALAKDFSQIESAVYVSSQAATIIQDGEGSFADSFHYVDGNLFDILQIPFLKGDRRTALDAPGKLVLTQSEAKKRFGTEDPIGKTLTLSSNGDSVDYRVAGVVQDPPKNSHLKLGIVARFEPQSFYADRQRFMTSWGSLGGWVYVKLKPEVDADDINEQLRSWEKRNIPDEVTGEERRNPGDVQDWRLTNIRDIHLGEAQRGSMKPGNDRRTIFTFAGIALLILAMAVINFTNLATARASQRAREVALRKVLGASRSQLIVQFLGETILLTALAMLLALAMLELLLPSFNVALDAEMRVIYWGIDGLLLPSVLMVLVVGTAAGLYPAFYLSRFQPARILRANQSPAEAEGSGRLRNALVIFQFAVSIGLIICTAIIYAQTLYARTADAGYQRDGLLQIDNLDVRDVEPLIPTLKNEVSKIDGVQSVALTGIAVNSGTSAWTSVFPPGSGKSVGLGIYMADPSFFSTMGMKLLAGRSFSEKIAMDDATTPFPIDHAAELAFAQRGVNVVITELAAERLGFPDPRSAIGKQVKVGLTLPEYGLVSSTIIGVVKDARFRSMRDPIQPIMFYHARQNQTEMMVRFKSDRPARLLREVEAVWKRIVPQLPFRGEFVDDRLRDLYEAEEARAQLFAAFAFLAVLIGCLGLFGLAAFTAERRTREIGIRKALGARSRDIVRLLTWQFSKPVIVANLIAWPVAWWAMREWLNGFDARIDLGPAPFLLAAILAFTVAIATIASHAFKVARANPIHALRYE